jgi:hypothetical protein
MLETQIALNFSNLVVPAGTSLQTSRAFWTQGRYTVIDDRALIFTGSPENESKTIDLPPLKLTNIQNPFVSLILLSGDDKPLRDSSRLLLAIVGRGGNKDMGWNEKRKSISDRWGSGPSQIEVIDAVLTIQLPGLQKQTISPLTESGQRAQPISLSIHGAQTGFKLGTFPTLWYEIAR